MKVIKKNNGLLITIEHDIEFFIIDIIRASKIFAHRREKDSEMDYYIYPINPKEINFNKECPKCRGRGEIMVRKPFLRDIDGSEDIGGTPYPEGCPRCNGRGVIL